MTTATWTFSKNGIIVIAASQAARAEHADSQICQPCHFQHDHQSSILKEPVNESDSSQTHESGHHQRISTILDGGLPGDCRWLINHGSAGTLDGTAGEVTCMAESDDGIHWTRPVTRFGFQNRRLRGDDRKRNRPHSSLDIRQRCEFPRGQDRLPAIRHEGRRPVRPAIC